MPKKSVHYQKLLKKWTKKHANLQKEIFEKHKDAFDWLENNSKQIAVGSAAGLFLLTNPIIAQIPNEFSTSISNAQTVDKKVFLIYDLKSILPQTVEPLTQTQEKEIAQILERTFNIPVTAELAGKRLNTSYGYIGQEQHLARYPGDNMFNHFEKPEEAEKYWKYGMAPGLGAWRYFADSKNSMTEEENLSEKYYIAVQTFLAPGFELNAKEYVDFFKFRKMLVVNPQNGKAVVAVIGDAGPAKWTGKSLGGSPEVMQYLERADGRQRGPVLYFFVDDPENKTPLGPISYN
ncbi:MAG: hypothetical protein COU25_01325 [Candidatus Levybacteria bacterium CG10_big_fil_rev_8_21_14_0_10_35_13]|nr:MAG: hypothetical protein COU25_01325 [Candidatus Levybacteria bacterium CG10_big_fil_rev_8_21_14_0_10_35_13]